jgi:hypothetical protein
MQINKIPPVKIDFKLLKEKELDKNTYLRITKNNMSERIFVEFICVEPKLTIQKNFQGNHEGKKKSEEFSKTIKNTNQMLEYFGIKR